MIAASPLSPLRVGEGKRPAITPALSPSRGRGIKGEASP